MSGMVSRRIDMLIPNYMTDFKCIGSSCEDTCCKGWRVEVDKETFYMYKKSTHIQLKPMFKLYVKRNRQCENDSNFGKIIMDGEKRCPFLDESNLCKIQLNLGAEYLSKTCWSYPRTYNVVDNQAEGSAVLSCPEVVRKVLWNPQGLSFERVNLTYSPKDGVVGRLNTQSITGKRDLREFFWEIRIMSLAILQNRTYSVDQRLVLLGMFLQNISELKDAEDFDHCASLINTFEEMVNQREFDSDLKAINFEPETQVNVVLILMKIKKNIGISGERYLRCFDETVAGFAVEDDRVDAALSDFSVFTDFFDTREYVLENYVVNEFFRELMPFGRYQDIWESYIYLCVMFSMAKIHLWGVGLYRGRLDEEIVVEVIQSLSKEVGHNPVLLRQFIEVLRESGFNTLKYMALLTKYPSRT